MVYLKSVENVITLGKLIGLLFLFCLPLSILFLKTKRNDLARPVMGTIFLVFHVVKQIPMKYPIYFILPLYIFCRNDIQPWYSLGERSEPHTGVFNRDFA